MIFKLAVEGTPDVSSGYKPGLTALGNNSLKISVSDKAKINGSLDIDNCTAAMYPEANRWDYAVSYDSEVFFIEVHSANTREVRVMFKKLEWLKNWLRNRAPLINKLTAKKNAYIWIQSKNFQIPKTSPQYRAAKSAGLLPLRKLELL